MRFRYLTVCVVLLAASCCGTNNNQDSYQYSKGPIPDHFSLGQSYPDRTEDQSCRPIQIHVERDTRRYSELVTYTKDNVLFDTDDSRKMTVRLHSQLSELADTYYSKYGVKLLVEKAWSEYPDDEVPETSLHYEGRSIRISVNKGNASLVLVKAAEIGFDWVDYTTEAYVTFCVIPDVCDAVVDLVFIQDQSGSVGEEGHSQALQFMVDVVNFFRIAPNETQIGLVTYSTQARVEFDLDDLQTKDEIQHEISSLTYPRGWTATALGLFQAGVILNPANGRGSRPLSEGIPKIAVLITDGKSNQIPIDDVAVDLQNSGVQVFTVGISNIDLDELLFIASDPDFLHVFLLDSFNDAEGFVDFLSFTTCDTPAIVEPGENTTTEVPEDGFRFFQTECAAFAVTVVIEQIDIKGRCHLYASNTVPNPGPVGNSTSVVKNEDGTKTSRTVTLSVDQTTRKVIYVSVRGVEHVNVFSIIIWDRIFNEEEYTLYVPEGVEGYLVIDLSAEISIPNESFVYRIADGNDGDAFRIGNTTGRIETDRPLDVNLQMQYKLAVVAENIEAACHRGRVKINVIVVPQDIVFEETPNVFVVEDVEIGRNLTRVVAMGNLLPIEYAIVDGNTNDAFEIDGITGDVSVANSLDFESVDFYVLTVAATMSTVGSMFATTTVNVTVLDINEPPFFLAQCALNNSCVFSVPEDVVEEGLVGSLPAVDPDLSELPNGTINYTLDSFAFVIDGTGTIITNQLLDREDQDLYEFTVTVSDGGSPSLSVETVVTVIVDDVNDNAPVFEQFSDSLGLFESIRVGLPFATYRAEDEDIGVNAEIAYSVDQSDLPFGFPDPTVGLLTVITPLDFESVQEYRFSVVASNPDGLNTSREVMITIMDVNDNSPIFEQAEYDASVSENSIAGTEVITVTANDADSGINAIIFYSIISGNVNDAFSLDRSTGVITTSNSLDREQVSLFVLTVRADDSGFPVRTGVTTVRITVDDVNDNAPMFIGDPYVATVEETLGAGLEVITVVAVDMDEPGSPNSAVAYSFLSGNVGDTFAIGSTSGVITVVSGLDYETMSVFELEVLATDMGTPAMTDTANVTVNILNVNEHPPVISGNQTIQLRENTSVGTEIAQFSASDLDQMMVSFLLVGPSQDQFSINSSSGLITLTQSLDFEVSQQIIVQIEASDGERTDNAVLVVNVIDVNEFAPVFQEPFAFSVDEESSVPAVVGTVNASDADGSDSVTFSLWPSTVANLFLIDRVTGLVTTNAMLDRETLVAEGLFQPPDSQESITVVATDTGTLPHSMTSQQIITITINDINDNPPAFGASSYGDSIPENMDAPAMLFMVSATDRDLGANGEIDYSISGSVLFSINSSTGQVSVNQPLDRETTDIYILTVTATDRGTPSLSSTARAIVEVIDVNDNDPQFTESEYEANVTENAPPVALLQIRANDADSGQNGEVSFSILGRENCARAAPPSACLFSIDADGIFGNTVSLDFEEAPQYEVTVVATDNGMPPRTSTTVVTVNVVNVDEFPPTFLGPCDASFPETDQTDLIVTTCPAEDYDDTQNAISSNTIVYSITSGNQGGTFRVDGTGTIRNNFPLDRESVDLYTLLLTVTDEGGLSSSMQVEISITDLNDNAPQFLNEPYFASAESAFVQEGFLIVVEASDQDQGVNAEITYTLIDTIENREKTETEVVVAATDSGSPSQSTETSINITFSAPCTSQEYEIDSVTGVVSGVFLCSVDMEPDQQLVIINSDYSFNCTLTGYIPGGIMSLYHNASQTGDEVVLSAGETNATFQRLNAAFVDAGSYQCEVQVTSGNLGSLLSLTSSVVSIVVPPSIIIPPLSAIVIEGNIATFQCTSIGVPDPEQTWLDNGASVVVESARFIILEDFLLITSVVSADSGTYTCRATNVAGQAQASAELTVVGMDAVVIATIQRVAAPDPIDHCNSFDSDRFQAVMGGITSQETSVTNTNGTFACNLDACHPNPCENSGVCNVTNNISYTCTCLLGYTGTRCETDIDECEGAVCLNGGTCMNTPGAFECKCPPGFSGDQCQFAGPCACLPNERCITVESESLCVPQESSSSQLLVSQPAESTTVLTQEVNLFQEDSQSGSRRKRDNSFVTVCFGAFYPVNGSDGLLALWWVCPFGVAPPTEEGLVEICRALVRRGLVKECTTPGGEQFSIPDIPPSTVDVHFVILDGKTGRPLNASQALDLLDRTNALQRLQEEGYDVTEFRAAVPVPAAPAAAGTTNVAAIVGGVLAAVVLVVLVGVIVAAVLAMRRRLRSNRSGYGEMVLSNTSATKGFESHFDKMGELMTPINDSTESAVTKYELQNGSPEDHPPLSPDRAPYSIFDDPIYDETSIQQIQHKPRKKTLSFGKKSKLHHTDSSENLLDDSDDSSSLSPASMSDRESAQPRRLPPKPPKFQQLQTTVDQVDDEEIYGNMNFKGGKNAGERWENYWKTATVFRGLDGPPKEK